MDIQYDLVVTLTPDDLANLIAEKVSRDIGSNFTVDANKISFVVEEQYEDRPCGTKFHTFTGAKVKADFIQPRDRRTR